MLNVRFTVCCLNSFFLESTSSLSFARLQINTSQHSIKDFAIEQQCLHEHQCICDIICHGITWPLATFSTRGTSRSTAGNPTERARQSEKNRRTKERERERTKKERKKNRESERKKEIETTTKTIQWIGMILVKVISILDADCILTVLLQCGSAKHATTAAGVARWDWPSKNKAHHHSPFVFLSDCPHRSVP